MNSEFLKTILHPPELRGRAHLRYWLALGAWFVVVFGLMAAMIGLLMLLGLFYDWLVGGEVGNGAHEVILIATISVGIVSVIYGDRLWSRLFIASGYLSEGAAIRILSNRAPTRKGERIHRWLGQAVLLAIYGILGVKAVVEQEWWVLVIVIPLAVWGIVLIRNAWKEADKMLAGGTIPPASEERIEYIEKELEKRRGTRGEKDVLVKTESQRK